MILSLSKIIARYIGEEADHDLRLDLKFEFRTR